MPYVKPIAGHTGTRGIMRYLEKEGRALAHDFREMAVPAIGTDKAGMPVYGSVDWAARMDGTRAAFDNDAPWKGKRARTFMHYVLSPSPDDRISLSDLRSLACAWADENFPGHEVAIIYHDDNEGRIPHAHIVVNNTNLDTGYRLQVPNPRDLTSSCQRIAAEMGLDHFVDGEVGNGARGSAAPRARRHADRSERELAERGGYSWVADIRARVDVARGIARNADDFGAALRRMGVNVRDSASRRGDWVYSLAETPSRQVTGSRLGAAYTKREVSSWLRSPVRRAPSELTAGNVRQVAEKAIELHNLGELMRLSEAVRVISSGGFGSLSAMDSAASTMRRSGGRDDAAERIERARAYCAEHGILPERQGKQQGKGRAGKVEADRHRGQQPHGSGKQHRGRQHGRGERDGR